MLSGHTWHRDMLLSTLGLVPCRLLFTPNVIDLRRKVSRQLRLWGDSVELKERGGKKPNYVVLVMLNAVSFWMTVAF